MATFSGAAGIIKVGSTPDTVGQVRSFTVEQTQDTIETTSMVADGDSTTKVSRSYVPGLSTYTISGDVYFADLAGTEGQADIEAAVSSTGLLQFKVYPSGDTASTDVGSFQGNAVVTSFSVTSSVDGIVEASFAAQGSGTLITQDSASIA